MTPARILVLEDNRVVARDIQQQLKRIGHEVLGTGVRGEDAVHLALESRPDLVLMDIRLEGTMDGVEAANRIRKQCQCPVVFLTAYSDDETVRRASHAEPFGYLLKPFEDSQLRTVIEMALYKYAAERKLRESERRYATTLSSIGDAVIATDQAGTVTFVNAVAEALTGWAEEDAIGRPVSDIFHIVSEETRARADDPVAKALSLGGTVGVPARTTMLISRDGHECPIEECASPIVDDRGNTAGAVLVFRDMTRRYRMDEELREAQAALARIGRLTAMGELTASIAHEVNQPLTAIVADAAACVQWLSDDHLDLPHARQAALRVVKDGQRAGEIVSSIRSLARNAPLAMAKIELNHAIAEVLGLLRSELRSQAVTLESAFAGDLLPAWGDRVQIQQVVLNLIMNGIEAMKDLRDDPKQLKITTQCEDLQQILVTITDTGTGLQKVGNERIFEPFYTTKPAGMGMGLSICRSIVEAHGGRLWATENAPNGCSFIFTLPAMA